MGKRNALSAFTLSAAVVASLVTVAVPAAAAPATAPSLSDFTLVETNTTLPAIVSRLDAQLPKLGVQNILLQANRDDAPKGPDCGSPALSTMTLPVLRKYCFVAGDRDTEEWMPQGVTTVADAQADQFWGDKQAILVSWYDKQTAPVKGVRVSFLDVATGNYQHVLLVYPFTNASGNPSYEPVTTPQAGNGGSVHAGGIVWYGNFLYVVDTVRGIRVFDMRYIFDIKSAANGDVEDAGQIGRQDGTYYSYGYRYVMPQIYGYSNPGGLADFPSEHRCNASGPQKFSYIGLDRSETPNALVTGEYCADQNDPNLNGRVARWPMNDARGLPAADGTWRATSAYRLPKPRVQGAVSTGDRFYVHSTGGGTTGPGHLQAAVPSSGGSTGVLTNDSTEFDVAIGVEDLSYWPATQELWTVTEHPEQRIIYSTYRP